MELERRKNMINLSNEQFCGIIADLTSWCECHGFAVESVYNTCHGTSLQEQIYYIFGVIKELSENANNQNTNINELSNSYAELKNFVDEYFKNLDLQKEVSKKLDEMNTDGSLDAIISKILLTSKLNYGYRVIYEKPESLNSYRIEGYTCQGFDSDGEKMCIIYHKNDVTPAILRITNINNGSVIFESHMLKNDEPIVGHFNSVSLYNGKLYIVQNTSTLIKVALNGVVEEEWSVDVCTGFSVRKLINNAGYNCVLGVLERGDYQGVVINMGYAGKDLIPVTQFKTDLGFLTRNGCATNGYIIAQHGYKWDIDTKSKISFYSVNGFKVAEFVLTGEWDNSEVEGIFIANDGSYIMVNTLAGNVYKIETPEIEKYQRETVVTPFGNNVAYNFFTGYYPDYNIGTIKTANNVVKEFPVIPFPLGCGGDVNFLLLDDVAETAVYNPYNRNLVISASLVRGSAGKDRHVRALYTFGRSNNIAMYRLTGIDVYEEGQERVTQYGNFNSPVSDDTLNKIKISGFKMKPDIVTVYPNLVHKRIPSGILIE